MDGVYSSWATKTPGGLSDGQIAALERLVPYLALVIKSVSPARMTGTLMETYLGRDAGQRVLKGRIVRGIADPMSASFLRPRISGASLSRCTASGERDA
jgi:adenylate cyclase